MARLQILGPHAIAQGLQGIVDRLGNRDDRLMALQSDARPADWPGNRRAMTSP